MYQNFLCLLYNAVKDRRNRCLSNIILGTCRNQIVSNSTFPKDVMHFLADVDECFEKTNNCDQDASCSNLDGSFLCKCNLGYHGNGTDCFGMSVSQ